MPLQSRRPHPPPTPCLAPCPCTVHPGPLLCRLPIHTALVGLLGGPQPHVYSAGGDPLAWRGRAGWLGAPLPPPWPPPTRGLFLPEVSMFVKCSSLPRARTPRNPGNPPLPAVGTRATPPSQPSPSPGPCLAPKLRCPHTWGASAGQSPLLTRACWAWLWGTEHNSSSPRPRPGRGLQEAPCPRLAPAQGQGLAGREAQLAF